MLEKQMLERQMLERPVSANVKETSVKKQISANVFKRPSVSKY